MRQTIDARERLTRVNLSTLLLLAVIFLQGCGLVYDAITMVHPLTRDELSAICARGRLRVGISVEPFRPFVFPAVYTDEGVRVTGLDIELIREVTDALTAHCGGPAPIVPTLHVTRFPDLFIKMNEGQLDLFVSSVSGTVPGARPPGLWFSTPYLRDDGIAAIVHEPRVAERVRTQFGKRIGDWDTLAAVQEGFTGLAIAVQKGRSAHLYAQANLKQIRLVVCDSLPAAIETRDPKIDVILSDHSILEYVTKRVWQDWQLLTQLDRTPLILTQEDLSVVTSDEHRRLQWFLNNLLFRLEESGRLKQMRTRWIKAEYAPTRRATTEGLPLEVTQVPDHYDQGQCRVTEGN
ncbi:MAG: transporter substrate-binding domain-containing protein [Nitrospira sp.]|nr:transporter substrate-binding domain-containing protein [Nitrospira sp.]MDH4243384.1 transporter substrate-binding domain-containing protein [Nitrospira sp.]MDH4355796.1 transporter substrate-binding domain-containing protein [Nitrospira sp.]MDH5318029.1 transporter substrate-binding domain-containing protein [Nitrospira sp.]